MTTREYMYADTDEEPTIPSFRVDLRSGRIIHPLALKEEQRMRFTYELRPGVGFGVYWNKWNKSIEINLPFLKLWVFKS